MADNMTIDELAGIIKVEFDNLQKEIKLRPTKTYLDEKINNLDEKIDTLKKELKKDIELRPTKTEMFSWADKRILDLELRVDRHDYMHINELNKLPSQPEISRVLAGRGLKERIA